MARAVTLVNCLGGAAIAVVFFLGYGDRSPGAVLQWALFYGAAIAVPLWWSRRVRQALARLDGPVPAELRQAAYYPVMAGALTMLLALSLIYRARQF
jgi:hypothetical protein